MYSTVSPSHEFEPAYTTRWLGFDCGHDDLDPQMLHGPRQKGLLQPRNQGHAETVSCIPETQTALLVTSNRTYRLVHDFPAPQSLQKDEVLIRTKAVGLNHIDWMSVEHNICLPSFPWITGREMAGVVDRVGSAVSDLKAGQRVWTSTYYKDRHSGCFQEFVVVPRHTVFDIPTGLDFNAAACLGVPAVTAAMTLWRWLGVPEPPEANIQPQLPSAGGEKQRQADLLLVWGASTATGQFSLRIAALAGLDTIAVCSESTARLVAELGATYIVTYTDKAPSHIVSEIVDVARGRLRKAVDVVGAETAAVVLEVIRACGEDHCVDFAPLASSSKDQVLPSNVRLQSVQMKQFILDPTARVYGDRLNQLLGNNKLRLPKLRVLQGGLRRVEDGLEMVKNGKLGGEKLVVSLA